MYHHIYKKVLLKNYPELS